MPSLRTYLAVALLGLCLSAPLLQAAEPPSRADVQSSLDNLADRKLPEAEQLAVKQTLEKTLALLDEKADSEQRRADLEKQLQQAPRLIGEAQRDYERLKNSTPTQVNLRYGKSTLPQLEQLLADRNAQLNEWQKQIIEANSLVITAQTRPERAQAEISGNQTRSQEINSILKSGRDASKPLSNERRNQLNAELAKLDAQTQLRRQELAGNSLLQDLGNSRRSLLEERIKRLEQELLDLQNLINEKRRDVSEQTLAEQSREVEKAGTDSLLAQESAINLKLSDYLLRATDRLNELTRLNLQTKQQLDSLSQSDQALEEQISVLQGSLLLSRILYKQQQALPTLKIDSNLPDQIADLRLYQFELNQQREAINNPSVYVDNLLSAQPNEADNQALRTDLLAIADTRRELIDRLNRELNALLNESITLQLNQKQLKTTAETLRATLDEQMFWIPSNKPLDLEWIKSVPRLLERQIAELPWGSNLRQLGAGLTERPLLFLPLLLLIGVLLWRRGYLYRKLAELHQDIGHFKRDSQLHTPMAIMLNVLLALPGTLFLALCGFALQMDARGQNANLGEALFQMAQAWLVFYTLYRILADGGVAELHFRWGRSQVAFLHRQVRRLGLVVMAMVAVVTVAKHQPAGLGDDVIGLTVVLTCYALMVWLLHKLLLTGPAREHASAFRMLIGIGLSLLPLALIIAVGLGYYYTALKLSDRLINTLYLLVIWLVIEATFVRGLGVAARRLAYQRATAKRQAQSKDSGEGTETVVEEPTLDIEQVNQQSLRLIRLALLGTFIAGLYWVWADLISVFAYLDNIALYQYSSGSGDAATLVPISLSDVLGALVIVGITIALGRNLPGLLEVLVLSRLNLAQGSAYATTTLLSYLIVAIGFVTTLSTLGVSWDKLQWLVAALSVGLGFGLQEIFANFISGLIILFERPVRIGDVVTIGNLSGTVSKIRIRATTITDFDRKEIIVPNKTFVTDQLINWSLNDTVTRVIIKVGVAYETDLPLARKLMMQAAEENPRVLRDPAPLLFFLTISASTFDYELRFHVRELGDRNAATDEILTRIALSFREHNVEMAFNQVEVMIKNLHGQELNLTTGQMVAATAAADAQQGQLPPPTPAIDPQ
ncbi:potassium efflux system protein [Pseudomonas peli]|jgi:potassium efflux system protein|uniref:Potassium efflux system protein n=1 Tax=Pseudomonas peli TaxID=592361 RepID=A0AB37Z597_9PSED|nr:MULTISPECIES: mechanosensitive channel MscK [Pseudomonas]MDR7023686.1 potassium efflux system protein [Pseudomonas peli]NMZ68315.1 mechanosensitive channel MscK [Pseudomonas peli]PJE42561.1 MAG: mechanosensitive channel MscK [Pseudomonas sp.] [Pseudomonas sp. FEMGT703P]SCW46596.1 potassium efflux system protein [Pseudomonas peli]|tara:strand:- start:15728 stop:19087 length:3360 start_codon:yes stop_codon:yes gene_type:complete